jgi:protein phosphatase
MFSDGSMERALLQKVQDACTGAKLWTRLDTDWVLLDCELMPWSAKAHELIADQYAPVGVAAATSLDLAGEALTAATSRGLDMGDLRDQLARRREAVSNYVSAYRRYCWTVRDVEDLRLAPFHLLATEGCVHADKNHEWHMKEVGRLAAAGAGVLVSTPYRTVDLSDERGQREAVEWWTRLTDEGGEGIVVKPFEFIARSGRGLVQPGIKCRGHEYLRIIYGAEYDLPNNLQRLRERGSLGLKRSLALREFALGVEAVHRLVRNEPLFRVHECVFGVLAMESEPIDPAL